MTTEDVSDVMSILQRYDPLYSRYTIEQCSTASDIWNRLVGSVDYNDVLEEIKKYKRGNYQKRLVFNPAMFVHFTLREALDIFKDYSVKVGAGSGFLYCGYPAEESEEDARIREMILQGHYKEPVTEIYTSIYPRQIIIKARGHAISRFWDKEEYDQWKESVKK